MQVVGIRRGVRRTVPEAPTRSRKVQRPRRVIVVAGVGKVEGIRCKEHAFYLEKLPKTVK